MRYYLCGHTGNMNRGCEAILRSTVKVLNQRNGDIYFSTFAPVQDQTMSRELGITMIPYAKYPSVLHRYCYAGVRKIFKKSLAGIHVIERPLLDRITSKDICLTIGGDTYCYNRPIMNLGLNKYTTKHNIKNILWCCSIEKNSINAEIFRDLQSYSFIFARESYTYQNLLEAGISKDKVLKCCDSAFFLDSKPVSLPQNFVIGNTVGINVSEMVISDSNPYVYQNIISLIQYILNQTNMSVCLIPHVYNIKNNTNDYQILSRIYQEVDDDRVSIIDKEYDCEQLKYIISQCRFFVGARTHAIIAAYSSGIPAIALGYSVKSKGIAVDLFGTYDGYVLPYDEIRTNNNVTDAFIKLAEKEGDIKKRYKEVLPAYKQTLVDIMKLHVIGKEVQQKPFIICDSRQCTGCLACVGICPQKCISVKKNQEGFEVPDVNFEECTNCGLCRKRCPVANKPKDDRKPPTAMAAVCRNRKIREESSSGGIFTVIAESIIDRGGVVFGVGFDEHFNAINKSCNSKEALSELRGSKYVQSSIKDVYKEARGYLDDGRLVLFTGTPCQIGGLRAYLNKDYENLYTQDLICRGVPSPTVWQKYVSYRENLAGSGIRKIFFRHKKNGWKIFSVQFLFRNCTEYIQIIYKDLYMKGFLASLFLRPSCSECSFKQLHRQSDLTLADFWGIDRLSPEKNDNKGTSLVLIHTVKGQELFDSVQELVDFWKVDVEKALQENTSMMNSVKPSLLREKFFKDMPRLEMDQLIEKYCGTKITSRGRRFIAKMFG